MFFFFSTEAARRPLKELASIVAGVSITRLSMEDRAAPIPVISLSDVGDEIRVREEILTTVHASSDTLARFCVQKNDVIVTTRGLDIRAAVVRETHHGMIAGANLAIIRLGGALLPVLLAAFLRQPQTRETLLRETAGASTPGFTIKALGELLIRVPPQDQQLTMAELIESITTYRQAVTRALQLRDAVCNEIIAQALAASDEAHG